VDKEPVIEAVDSLALTEGKILFTDSTLPNSKLVVGCGKAIMDEQILIVNPETLTACPSDRVGEVWVSGQHVAQGYWQKKIETIETFQAQLADSGKGPFLRTGDLGFMKDGELFITGRCKDLIIIAGHNYYPQDIELTVEKSHKALKASCSATFS